MIHILLSILCSSAIAITMKVSDRLGQSGIAILCVNYLFATVFALIPALRCGSPAAITPMVGFLGIVTGVLFLVTFILDQHSIIHNGAVLTTTFMKMGILVPILLSRILWHEKASMVQTLGILTAIAAILVMTIPEKNPSAGEEPSEDSRKRILWILPILLLCAGSADSMSKFYAIYGIAAINDWYLFLTFFTAFLLCFPLMLKRGERFNLPKLGLGSILGLVNYASTLFLLLAVAELPAYLVYPLVNVLIIACITLVCMTVFRERLSRRQRMGLGLVILAVVLLNL